MNIQQYYRYRAAASLNGSFAALIPVFIIVIPLLIFIGMKEVVILAVPFLLYSFISYQIYLIEQHRFINSEVKTNLQSHGPMEKEQYLLTFMPAPSLRLLLFTPDGQNNIEICDKRKNKLRWFLPYFLDRLFPAEYGLFHSDNRLLVTFKWKRNQGIVMDENGITILEIEMQGQNLFFIRIKDHTYRLKIDSKKMYTDVQFFQEGHTLQGRVRKGWMPLEWGKHFVDANTPVLTFLEESSKEERLAILAILIKIYRYHNH